MFMIVFSITAVSADDSQNTDFDVVSGDVDVATANPWSNSGSLNYDVPSDAKEIKHADLYVNVYAGSAKTTYGANANVSITTPNGEQQIASEQLWSEDGSSDGTVYVVNDHVNKCYSDFQMYYDLTETFKGLNGSSISIKVDTFKMENKSFDGRIKLIALVLAYDDGDSDTISYWVDSTQRWTKTSVATVFGSQIAYNITEADLINIALSSADGTYRLNGQLLGDADSHTSGNYYQYNYWNVTDRLKDYTTVDFNSTSATTGSYPSLKNVLTVLKIKSDAIISEVSFTPEYITNALYAAYAGTNNTMTIKANTNKPGKYIIELIADGVVVNSTEADLDESFSTILLTDPTIRPIDETTVYGANNKYANYVVNVIYNGTTVVSSANEKFPVLFNGNLGYDLEYGVGFKAFEEFFSGDIVFDVKETGYLGASDMTRTDVWNVNIDDGSELSGAFLLIPYNWFNNKDYTETVDMFNVTFNNQTVTPLYWFRDQGNLGKYANYGYGVLVYSVVNLMNASGENKVVLVKNDPTPAVYPSTLIYWYDTPGGSIKELQFVLGADLLSNSANGANRPVKSDNVIEMSGNNFNNATLYVLAAGAEANEGNIIFNGEEYVNVWSGSSKTTNIFTKDITGKLNKTNDISFVSTGSTILSLSQLIVTDTGVVMSVDSLAPEYTTNILTAYAGTNNTITITVSNAEEGLYNIMLYADGNLVNTTSVNLTAGTHTIKLTDPTIRPLDETTVIGANNTYVTYVACMEYNGSIADNGITVPVLYNGNLGKDFEYNATFIEDTTVVVANDIVVLTQDQGTYMAAGDTSRAVNFYVTIGDGDEFVKAFIYIAYNWDKSGLNGPEFNVTFNGNNITPKSKFRDQGNLGKYGSYGYGLYVYDVTEFIQNGMNELIINKANGLTAVYPANMICFVNQSNPKWVNTYYLLDGADLLSNASNDAGRIAKTDSQLIADNKNAYSSSIIIFAAGAEAGEGDLIINGIEEKNVWSGTSKTFDSWSFDSYLASKVYDISFVATGGTILALNQIITIPREITESYFRNMTVTGDATVSAILVDGYGFAIANQTISYAVNGVENFTTTDENGEFTIQAAPSSLVVIVFGGTEINLPVITDITLRDLAPARGASVISAEDYTTYAIDYNAGERGGYFKVQLLDEKGIPLANKTVQIGFNGKVYTTVTNETGWAQLQINLAGAGTYTFAVAFLGDENYNASFVVQKIVVNKKKTTIDAPAKSYKASAKTKSYTVTLKTDKGSSIDGKTYMASGKKVTMTLNGKTYAAKTNSKGQATFKLSITKKGTFSATVKFDGDKTYAASSKSVKITIK